MIDGLLANIPRVEARRALLAARARVAAEQPDADLMRAAGIPEGAISTSQAKHHIAATKAGMQES